MTFVKGDPRINRAGRPKGRRIIDIIEEEKGREWFAKQYMKKISKGNTPVILDAMNRLDGKPVEGHIIATVGIPEVDALSQEDKEKLLESIDLRIAELSRARNTEARLVETDSRKVSPKSRGKRKAIKVRPSGVRGRVGGKLAPQNTVRKT